MTRLLFKIFFSLNCFFFSLSLFAQLHVKFVLKQRPVSHSADSVFAAGSFNTWNSEDTRFIFKHDNSGNEVMIVNIPEGDYQYKFTRGNWDKIECADNGKDIGTRSLTITKDTTINIVITAWRDDFKTTPVIKRHSASSHVIIMDTAFYMPQLKCNRRIWLYLPGDYYAGKKRFPVLYMHDGQNLFDDFTAGFGEWGVDEYFDSVFMQDKKECIVVGIDNGPERMNEYNPYDLQPYGKGQGNEYVNFLVDILKPYVDGHFRTLPNKKNTFIAGSSMGGLISLYAVMKYPEVFGGAGIFSPAFWTAAGLKNDLLLMSSKINSKLFFYIGGKENASMMPDMRNVESVIKASSSAKIFEEVDPEAQHNEAAWRKYFPDFYRLVISD